MHALSSEIGGASIGTSTLFAAWNAAIYVNQIEDQRVEEVIKGRSYLDATSKILNKHGGLWFNDETFVISKAKQSIVVATSRHPLRLWLKSILCIIRAFGVQNFTITRP